MLRLPSTYLVSILKNEINAQNAIKWVFTYPDKEIKVSHTKYFIASHKSMLFSIVDKSQLPFSSIRIILSWQNHRYAWMNWYLKLKPISPPG